MKKVAVLLFLITFLGGLLRFREITVNPPNLNTDEAAIGYNAYSILKTGRDEYGQKFPLAFRSFDDYKPPLFIYLTVPSVAVFGLNEFAVRFPPALLGVLAIVLTYFLTKKLFGNCVVGLLASFLLAISPWHIQFTRAAYETGSNAFFTTLGFLLFLKGLENKWYFVLAGLIFGLQTHLYQASKVFVPLFVFCLIIIYFRRLSFRPIFLFLAPLFLVVFPAVILITTSAGLIRFRGTSIFQDPKSQERQLNYTVNDWLRNDNKSVMLFHPEFMVYFQDILVGYLSHFRPDFLLTGRNDPKVSYVPEVGLVQLWTFPFLLAGIYYLFRRKDKTATAALILWILISPIPASVTIGVPNSTRAAIILPALQIVTAFGLVSLFPKLSRPVKIAIFLFVIYFFAFYLHMLFVHAPIVSSSTWYSGYKKIVQDSAIFGNKYQKIIVSTGFDEPQIFYLFYLRYDPATYLAVDGGTVSGGFDEQRNHFAKYYFHSIDWIKMKEEPDNLLVATPKEIPKEAKNQIIGRYYSLDGKLIAYFVRT